MERFPTIDLERERYRDFEREKQDKTELGFDVLSKMKASKRKGKVTFHLDGSGAVAKIEVVEFV
jgi:hypothetical protein